MCSPGLKPRPAPNPTCRAPPRYCGGTEIGGGFLTGTLLQPQVASAFSTPSLGASLVLLGPEGEQSPHESGRPFVGWVRGQRPGAVTRSAAGPSRLPAPPARPRSRSRAQPRLTRPLPNQHPNHLPRELALVPPMLGSSQRLLNRDHAATYYGGMPRDAATGRTLRRHGDEVARLAGGYYRALGRCDDTMNLGGIKVGPGPRFWGAGGGGRRRGRPPEAVAAGRQGRRRAGVVRSWAGWSVGTRLPAHGRRWFPRPRPSMPAACRAAGGKSVPAPLTTNPPKKVASVELERAVLEAVGELVLEAAAIGAPTPGGGPEQLHLFVVPRPGAAAVADEARLLSACQAAVRAQLNPLFKVERVIVVDSLPRTASNKVMRRVLRDRAASPTSPRHRM